MVPLTHFDDSEFPSLSGTSQPQYQNPSQAIWQRAVQQTPVQRPQHSNNTQVPQQQQISQPRQGLSSPTHEDMFMGSHLQGSLEEYRQGAQNQNVNSRQPQTTSIDDFPPLGRNGTDENDGDQRGNMMGGGAYGFPNSGAFAQQQNARHGLPNTSGNQADSTRSSSVVDRTMSPSTYGGQCSSSECSRVNVAM